jgi:hypothetical protein
VHETRTTRDRAWAEVKEPWLSGALPDDQTRARLADAVDARTRDADEASDDAIIHAEGTGRVLEVNTVLAERVARLEELWEQRGALAQTWSDVLAEAGVPSVVDPTAWEIRSAALDALAGHLHEEHTLTSAVDSDEKAVSGYASEVATVGTELEIAGTDTWSVLSDAIARVTETRKNQAAVNALQETHDKATRKREGVSGKLVGVDAVIAGLKADDELDEVVQRSREMAAERQREQTCLDQMRHAARPGSDLEELAAKLAGLEGAQLESQEADARTNLDLALEARDAARDQSLESQASLRDAEQIGDAASTHA